MGLRKRISNLSKARMSFTVVTLSAWTLLAVELSTRWQFFADHALFISLFVAVGGVVIILTDHSPVAARTTDRAPDPGEESPDDSATSDLFERRHWGRVLLGAAVITVVVATITRPATPVPESTSVPVSTPVPESAPLPEVIPPPVITSAPPKRVKKDLPPMDLKGLSFSKGRPVALINNKTYGVGDELYGLKILAIEQDAVIIGLGGSSVRLTQGENRLQVEVRETAQPKAPGR